MSNKNSQADFVHIYQTWPNTPPSGYTQLVVVNPFIKHCCGASPMYTVHISNESIDYQYKDLVPIDDFFCVNLPANQYEIKLYLNSNASQKSIVLVEGKVNDIQFLAADIDLRKESLQTSLYIVEEKSAMKYVNQTLHRISITEPWLPTKEKLNSTNKQKLIKKRLQRQIKCDLINTNN